MTFKIPTSLKKEFQKGFAEYTDAMGEKVTVYLSPYTVDCPNCLYDNVQKKSANIYNTGFLRPVYIFPETPFKRIVYPQPFNVLTTSGVQFDPSIIDPKSLIASVCPICMGEGTLVSPNSYCMQAVVTWDYRPKGEDTKFLDLSAGRESKQVIRIKTYDYNYALCRDANYFILNGSVKAQITNPAKLKGLGGKHITEVFLIATAVDSSPEAGYNVNQKSIVAPGNESNQAPIVSSTIPPNKPGDDVW
jgi:hypothetical protein